VIHQHGGDFQGFYYRELSEKGRLRLKKVLGMADVFIVLTESWRKFFTSIVDEKKIKVIPNAIQVPPKTDKEYGKKKLLFLGRICKEKGIRELLDVIIELSGKYTELHLYMGGIFEDNELKDIVSKHSEKVTFLGWIDEEEKERYLKMCDIFVLPSYFEGQPVSVLEAMAHGMCVVASCVGGIPEMIEDGKNGFLIEPKDKTALKCQLIKVLNDKNLCKELGEAAYQEAQERFSIGKSMESLVGLYEEVMKE